jgi:hypothetical protein
MGNNFVGSEIFRLEYILAKLSKDAGGGVKDGVK